MAAQGFQDNIGNILGTNTADNLYNSDTVAANANGSMIERQEYIQAAVAALTTGAVLLTGAQDTASSTTSIKISELTGFGDDFFNTQFYIQVLNNANSAGASPENETRQITDYVSSTGTFTCTAFGAAVEVGDLCLILHESQIAIGRDDSDNVIATTNVVANADGSILERIEYAQSILTVPTEDLATDATTNQVVGKKSDTVAGTSLVAIAKQNAAALAVAAVTGVLLTTIADGTAIPDNSQAAGGLLATATGAVMIEEITIQRAGTNLTGPTNYEFTTDNANGLTGAASPLVLLPLADFNANKTTVASLDGSVKQLPFVLETGKKLYIHGDDAPTGGAVSTDFYIKYEPVTAGATLA